MDEFQVLLYALASFFGIEGGLIGAEKTTVTIYPQEKKIEILQEGLFSIITSEKDSAAVVNQWNEICFKSSNNSDWAEDLDSLPNKSLIINAISNNPFLTLHYSNEKHLWKAIGVSYDDNKKQFSIINSSKDNLKTKDGYFVNSNSSLKFNTWYFNNDSIFSFTIEPFEEMPEKYSQFKRPLFSLVKL